MFGWLKRASRDSRDAGVEQWRRDWHVAAAQPSAEHVANLTRQLRELGLDEDDLEIEQEMLDALERAVALEAAIAGEGLPSVETGHRIAGADRCHFSAPASIPDDAAQPSGRLLLTSTRAAFAAGPASRTVPWHAIAAVLHEDRDLLLVRADRQSGYRFRCNSYGDALCAALIARRLTAPRAARSARV